MDDSEKLVNQYLMCYGFEHIAYEPDGNVPPDFLADGRIAVEVRRLNQNEVANGKPRGLEETEIPLLHGMRSLLPSLGPPTASGSWYVWFRFRRPVEQWGTLRSKIKGYLKAFRDSSKHQRRSVVVSPNFRLSFHKALKTYDHFFVLGGYSDWNSGGWLLSELERNLKICIEDKTRKTAKVWNKYPEWWLILIDRIGYGLVDDDWQQFQDQFRIEHDWNKVVILDPSDPRRGFEV